MESLEKVVEVKFLRRTDGEYFVWSFLPSQLSQAMSTVGRFAADPELSLDWQEAKEVCDLMRELVDAGNVL